MKIVSIVGARPQFIKLAPLSKAIRENHHEVILHSGQHYDYEMSETFFRQLGIPKPDHNLEIGSGGHGMQTGMMMQGIEKVLIKEKPDAVIVFGDTNTTLAGALVASKLLIPSVHVESGLRSYNRSMPEEINRVVADHVCDVLLAPTQKSLETLHAEGLENHAWLSGDIMVDSLEIAVNEARKNSLILDELDLEKNDYYLLTLHRPVNVDDPAKLQLILKEINQLDKTVIFPVHPRTRKIIRSFGIHMDNINYLEPAGYLDFLTLQKNALKIITDSGGIQKEAFILRRPCITLRTETEWVETVEQGWNKLIPPDEPGFAGKIQSFIPPERQAPVFGKNVASRMKSIIEGQAHERQ